MASIFVVSTRIDADSRTALFLAEGLAGALAGAGVEAVSLFSALVWVFDVEFCEVLIIKKSLN